MRRIGILMVAVVLAAAACSSSSGSKPTPSSKPATTTSAAKPANGAAIIAAGLMRPTDLVGWDHGPPSEQTDDLATIGKDIPGCERIVREEHPGIIKEGSEQFTKGDAQVLSSVDAYADLPTANGQLDVFRDPSTPTCMRGALLAFVKDQIPDPSIISSFDISPISVNEVGDSQYAYRSTLRTNVNGDPGTLLTDIIGIRVGRFLLTFNPSAPTTAELAQLESDLLPKLVERMKQAGA